MTTNTKPHRSAIATVGLAAATALILSSCATTTEEGTRETAPATTPAEPTATSPMTTPARTAPAGLIGSGCADYADQVPTGPGSVESMATEPVVTAAGNSPVLSTLASALTGKLNPGVNLTETLNNGQFTVFAPTDDAFGKVDPATIDKLKTDSQLLTSVLTFHVVPEQADPQAVIGEHKTVQGQPVTVTGSGDDLEVNGAGLVCGGIRTANATLYLIDTVLLPPAAPATPGSPATPGAPATPRSPAPSPSPTP
ncbi:fasciclin domain-containing protein [Mycolicibacterium sp.]|uniref:fasciclin domain-containing protein n=1 Tax=Mycolicibacterium sp. TaxID=2320850 RepID=UPI0028A6EAF5|nr:fasciclin domain-containing protein [Mycolicibacterium sp.]